MKQMVNKFVGRMSAVSLVASVMGNRNCESSRDSQIDPIGESGDDVQLPSMAECASSDLINKEALVKMWMHFCHSSV
jgi:hypothetical protein